MRMSLISHHQTMNGMKIQNKIGQQQKRLLLWKGGRRIVDFEFGKEMQLNNEGVRKSNELKERKEKEKILNVIERQ